ncbi:hypothetical protein HYU11_05865 [Candidatus Woesearchaeota archaeon]|nr:hypothetical protein [Candidatus Woesearchaeota archaeon]
MHNDVPSSIFIAKGKRFVVGLPNKSLAFFWRHKRFFILGFFCILVLVLFGGYIKNAVTILLLTLIASFSTYYKKYIRFTLGFELVTFSTVLTTVAYGPLIGAIVGFVSAVAAEVIPQLIDPSSLFWIISLPVSAFVVAFFHGLGVPLFWLGFISLFVQYAISEPMRIFSGDDYLRTMGFVNMITTLGWAILWFRVLAPVVFPLL